MQNNFQAYIINLPDSLLVLEKIASKLLDKRFSLDYSIESLNSLETVLLKKIEKPDCIVFSIEKIIEMISGYMGEIVRKELNGKWRLCIDENDMDFGYPMVTFLDGLPRDFGWSPIQDVYNFQDTKKIGLLKQATNSVLPPY